MAEVRVWNDLEDFSIELNETEGRWSVTIESYRGESEKVVIPPSFGGIPVRAIGDYVFLSNEGVKHVSIPEGVTSIESVFGGCKELACVELPESLASIGDGAFEGCAGLTGIKLPAGLASIGDGAFKNCTGLTGIRLPEGLAEIGGKVFSGCAGLTEITVDENNPAFTAVDGVLFDKAMTTLILYPEGKKGDYAVPDTVVEIGDNAFDNCRELTRMTLPQSLVSFGYNTLEGCERLTDILVNEHNPDFCSIDGVVFDKERTDLWLYPQGKGNTEYTVPDETVCITVRAFYECKRLTGITLPEGLELILHTAFRNCEQLKAVTLPASLRYIGEFAFHGCTNLETITLSGNTKMGYKALEGFSGRLVYRD